MLRGWSDVLIRADTVFITPFSGSFAFEKAAQERQANQPYAHRGPGLRLWVCRVGLLEQDFGWEFRDQGA